MNDYINLTVDGTSVETEEMLTLSEGFRVQVETNYGGYGYESACENCDAMLDGDGVDENGETGCPQDSQGYGHDDDAFPDCPDGCTLDGVVDGKWSADHPDHFTSETFGPHVPVRAPLAWLNSASIDVDGRGEVTMNISVGDPRGAFAFTVRELTPDGEAPYLIIHTPYPGMSWAHMPLTEMHPGTYRVMPHGWTPPVEPDPEPVAVEPLYAVALRQARGYLTRWERARLAGRMLLSLLSFRTSVA